MNEEQLAEYFERHLEVQNRIADAITAQRRATEDIAEYLRLFAKKEGLLTWDAPIDAPAKGTFGKWRDFGGDFDHEPSHRAR